MSGVPTPPPTATPPTAATGGSASAATPAQTSVGEAPLRELPEKLLNLTRPVVVTGTVAGETPEGLTRVRTAVGDVLLKSPTPLPVDKPVTLQIPAGSPPTRANVLAQLATPPSTPSPTTPALASPLASTIQSGAAPAQNPVVLLATQTATAVAPPPSAGPALTVGGVISAVVLATNPKPIANTTASASSGAPTGPGPAVKGSGSNPGASSVSTSGETSGTTTPQAGATTATTTGGASTQGQAVTLGGDAAHPGTATPQSSSGQSPAGQPPAGQLPTSAKEGAAGEGTPKGGPAEGEPNDTASGGPSTRQGRPATNPGIPGDGTADFGDEATDTRATPTSRSAERPATSGASRDSTASSMSTTAAAENPPGAASTTNTAAAPRTSTISRMALPDMGDQGSARPTNPTTAATTGTATETPAGITTSPKGATGGTTAPPPPSATPSPTATANPTTATPEAAAQLPRTGQTLALKVVSLTAPDGTASPLTSTSLVEGEEDDGQIIRGTVAGTTPQGKPILATPDGMLALNTTARPPIGTLLTLRVTDPAALDGTKAADAAALPDYLTGRDWPALREVLGALGQMDPALVQSLLHSIIPQPNKKLGAALTFFVAAMRGGDARGWLGAEATRTLLKGGKASVLSGFDREVSEKGRQASDAAPADWRAYPVPFYDQSGINAMALHIHPFPDPEEEDKGDGGGQKGSRFVLDVDLSRLGPLQLDGMVKPPRFDLILRSRTALPLELRQELRDVFKDSLETVGFDGGLSFQNDSRGWVKLARQGSSAPAVTA